MVANLEETKSDESKPLNTKIERDKVLAQFIIKEEPETVGYGYRHQQTALLFVCLMVAYSMRTCMGVALVAMVFGFHDKNTSITNSTSDISLKNETDGSVGILNGIIFVEPFPTFQWDKKIQDIILAAFSWGYMILQIPAGQLAHRFGTRRLLTGALVINGVVSFCTPWAAFYGSWIFVVICRMLQGLSQSCFIPGMHTTFGKWTPLEERGRLTAFAYGGQALGTVLGLPITGFIAASPLGWPGIFRFYGILSLSVGAVLWFLGADSPAEHPKISVAERRYIEEALGQTGIKGKKHLKVPWKKILQSKATFAIVVAHIGQTWGQLTLYTEVPAFMDKVMKVNIKANGLLTALPFFVMWLSNFFFSWFTDMFIVKKWLSVTNTRKMAHTLGCVPAAIGLIALSYVKKDIIVVETILVLICAFKIAAHLGWHVNPIDLAPNFAGTIMSVSNFTSNLFGSVAPVVAGFILAEDVTSELLWRKVFLVAAGFYLVTDLVYVMFGSAELQEWNNPEEKKENIENREQKPMLDNEKFNPYPY